MGKTCKYAVVIFQNTNEVSVVPNKWLQEEDTLCYWPLWKDLSKLAKAIRDTHDPEKYWKQYSIRVLTKCGKYYI